MLGGALIGTGAVALMAFNGRIAGVTGILSGALQPEGEGRAWRLVFLAAAILAPALMWLASGEPVPFATDVPAWATALSGLLVGIGVTFGGGCTSGHGVCGIARLSVRSIAATASFMAFALATVFVIRHLLGGF
jgi:uncharacterized membrane protein YedE/YeeE